MEHSREFTAGEPRFPVRDLLEQTVARADVSGKPMVVAVDDDPDLAVFFKQVLEKEALEFLMPIRLTPLTKTDAAVKRIEFPYQIDELRFILPGYYAIVALYSDFLSKLNFNVQFDVLDIELSGDLGFIRTHSHGAITPKGQTPVGGGGNREIFVVKKIDGKWKFYRYIFNADV